LYSLAAAKTRPPSAVITNASVRRVGLHQRFVVAHARAAAMHMDAEALLPAIRPVLHPSMKIIRRGKRGVLQAIRWPSSA
jgi:hypothetical protein